jgi:hypothetical protein
MRNNQRRRDSTLSKSCLAVAVLVSVLVIQCTAFQHDHGHLSRKDGRGVLDETEHTLDAIESERELMHKLSHLLLSHPQRTRVTASSADTQNAAHVERSEIPVASRVPSYLLDMPDVQDRVVFEADGATLFKFAHDGQNTMWSTASNKTGNLNAPTRIKFKRKPLAQDNSSDPDEILRAANAELRELARQRHNLKVDASLTRAEELLDGLEATYGTLVNESHPCGCPCESACPCACASPSLVEMHASATHIVVPAGSEAKETMALLNDISKKPAVVEQADDDDKIVAAAEHGETMLSGGGANDAGDDQYLESIRDGEEKLAAVVRPRTASNITVRARFPGDAGHVETCYTDSELRQYLDYIGIDHERDDGVHLIATPYYVQEDNSLQVGEVRTGEMKAKSKNEVVLTTDAVQISFGHKSKPDKPDGFHYFFTHTKPDNKFAGRRCFDPDLMSYESDLRQVGPDSREVRWGCTPFRIASMKLQEAISCARDIIGKEHWPVLQAGILRELSWEAQRHVPATFDKWVHRRLQRFFGDHAKIVKLAPDNVTEIAECFQNQQRPLMCVPAISGSSGMLGNGVSDHDGSWVRYAADQPESCMVPSGCARLAATNLLHFQMRPYETEIPALKNATRVDWNAHCMMSDLTDPDWIYNIDAANERVYSACFRESLKRVCGTTPECCPSVAYHYACKTNVDGEKCNSICSPPEVDYDARKVAREMGEGDEAISHNSRLEDEIEQGAKQALQSLIE